jgi:peptidoglycan/LPS O-acetylase OafA/YrhL
MSHWIESCVDEFFIGREVFSAISGYIFGELIKRCYIAACLPEMDLPSGD